MKPGANPPKIIDEKCNACGQCVSVCPSFVIDLVGEKAGVMRADWCIGCGHCGAVCPTEAVRFDAAPGEIHPNQGRSPAASPEVLELLLRERRSVRNYTQDPIPQEMLRRVLEAGSYAPTGTNSQNVYYTVLTTPEEISRLRERTVGFYGKIFAWAKGRISGVLLSLVSGRRTVDYLLESLPKIEYAYEQMRKGEDRLFYHAPVVALAHAESWDSSSAFNCSVALYHCSLMAHTLGLGCCFNGFLVNAVNHDRRIRSGLGIPRGHRCYAAMTLGYPKVRYQRLVHRDPPKIRWK